MLHLPQLCSQLAAAAGRAATLADVAAAPRAHLGAAGQAKRRVGDPALVRLDQLGRSSRPGGCIGCASLLRLLASLSLGGSCPRLLPRRGLRELLGVDLVADSRWILAVQH